MRTGILFLLLFGLITLSSECDAGQWLFYHDKEIRGRVVEADTGKPIEGALVIAIWKLTDVVGEGPGGDANVEVTETDRDGHFVISSWIRFKPWKFVYTIDSLSPEIIIFKPGYMVHLSHKYERSGFNDDNTMSSQEKSLAKIKYGIDPANLKGITNDKDRLRSLNYFCNSIDIKNRAYSKNEYAIIYKAYQAELRNLAVDHPGKPMLLKRFYEQRKIVIGE